MTKDERRSEKKKLSPFIGVYLRLEMSFPQPRETSA